MKKVISLLFIFVYLSSSLAEQTKTFINKDVSTLSDVDVQEGIDYYLIKKIIYTKAIAGIGAQYLDFYKIKKSNSPLIIIVPEKSPIEHKQKNDEYYSKLAKKFLSKGYSVAAFNYPSMSSNNIDVSDIKNKEVTHENVLSSLRCGVRHLTANLDSYEIANEKIIITGVGSGADIAKTLAKTSPKQDIEHFDNPSCEYNETNLKPSKDVILTYEGDDFDKIKGLDQLPLVDDYPARINNIHNGKIISAIN